MIYMRYTVLPVHHHLMVSKDMLATWYILLSYRTSTSIPSVGDYARQQHSSSSEANVHNGVEYGESAIRSRLLIPSHA